MKSSAKRAARDAAERALLHQGGRAGSWGNLGLWPLPGADGTPPAADDRGSAQRASASRDAPEPADYASACRALALAVGRAAGLAPGSRVLSVACGAGEELRLWRQQFGVAAVCGVEREAAAVRAAYAEGGLGEGHTCVLPGSGSALLALGLQPGSFDAVVCVDAAYHLNPRSAFLQGAFTLLRPGGRLAYTDLLLDDAAPPDIPSVAASAAWKRPAWKRTLLRASARACGLSAAELPSPQAHLQALQALGYIEPSLRRLDVEVLDGFARHVRGQAQRHGLSAWQAAWRRPAITARLIGPCRAAGLGYALIAATRP